MFKNMDLVIRNCHTEGFGVSTPAPLTISVGNGTYVHEIESIRQEKKYNNKGELIGYEPIREKVKVRDFYTAFEFDVESDPDFPVIYDVYLVRQPSKSGELIHVSRTVMGGNEMAYYTGEDDLIHCLMTFMVTPNTTSLDDVEIRFNNILEVK
jgi:hypothetical protein